MDGYKLRVSEFVEVRNVDDSLVIKCLGEEMHSDIKIKKSNFFCGGELRELSRREGGMWATGSKGGRA